MITIVVGAQYGGEGKGKVCAYLSYAQHFDIACRCGGPNSSHSVLHGGQLFKLRMMPAAAVHNRNIDVFFGAGTLLHVPTLLQEMALLQFRGRLLVDPKAGVINEDIVAEQRRDDRYAAIGSTLTGTGLASALRAQRKLPLAADTDTLRPFLGDVSAELWRSLARRNILVEGHQGFGLSNYHGDYPYTSSRDSTASAMLSELGIGPPGRNLLRVVLAVKAFPTRNHAGSLSEELNAQDADALGIAEFGGGAWGIPDRRRRVGLFDMDLFSRAIMANAPSEIALTGADYIDHTLRGTHSARRSEPLEEFIARLEQVSGVRVRYVSTGPDTTSMFERRRSHQPSKRSTPGEPDLFSRN
ncbi:MULTISPECIES: adenylosuccinate synthetase [unclassified Devosia]|uniref:adenylosuccinate synthetase n=1 Tax=unclassified Devosia TaxID=196773 RepID=UPI00086C6E44|nr:MULTISPECIES: adenylosuccinate synthetase [unclassified Devosia]MBN9360734.1 adenylosuccinate synthetase [Devosia sp.]ODS87924.1 MAG: hypothetical protein ABS47_11105 [Devosia sp. SCN 66-27]OJX22699.1 MAG: hypothetical protein BGO83_18085 [Devosia sp. 66-14]